MHTVGFVFVLRTNIPSIGPAVPTQCFGILVACGLPPLPPECPPDPNPHKHRSLEHCVLGWGDKGAQGTVGGN